MKGTEMTTEEWKDANARAMADPEVIDVEGEEIGASVAALAPIKAGDALVRPAASVSEVEEAFHDYQALCARLLDRDDVQQISGRTFRKKSAWRKLAVAFGVSCEVRERIYDRDEKNNITRAEIVVRATAPNGRYMDGLGVCDISERRFSKPQHDIPATAMTRATNRACADLFGMGEVSAEEIMDDPLPRRKEARARDIIGEDVDPDATQQVIDALRELPDAYRAMFKEWRKEQGIGWPIPRGNVTAVRQRVAEIVLQAAKDSEPF
jgi:hypothetical protein